MADVGGGRVYIEVVGDSTGLRDDVAAKVAAETEGIEIRLGIRADDGMLREQVAAAARLAEAGEEVQLRVEARADGLREELAAAAVEASAGEAAHVGVELETGAEERIRAHLEEVAARASVGVDAHVGVDVDRGGQLGGAGAGLVADSVRNLDQEGQSAATAAASTGGLGISAMAAGIALAVLTGGLGAAAGAAGALVGAIAPLGGLLAALPAGVAVLGAVGGTVFAALHGIGGAVSALGKQQSAGGASAVNYADQQRAAAERVQQSQESVTQAEQHLRDVRISSAEQIKQAQQSLANTDYQTAQQRISDARSVVSAEYQLQQAELSLTDAQRQLNDAQQQAARNLEDMANASVDAALAQQQAQLDLEAAQQAAAQTGANPNATAQQRQQAALNVAQAQQHLTEATERASRAAQDNTKAQAAGISGNQQVISATQQVAAAQHSLQQATQAVTDAQNRQAHDSVAGAQAVANAQQHLRDTYRTTAEEMSNAELSVRDAERGLADALRAQQQAAAKVGGAASAANTAMSKLSPLAQAFARQIRAILDGPVKDLEARAQNALLPGLSRALTTVAGPNGLWPQLNRLVTLTGTAVGVVAQKLADVAASPATRAFIDRLGPATHAIVLSLGDATAHWANIMRDFASAALPLVQRLAGGLDVAARHLDAFFSSRRGQQDLTRFFDQVYRTTHAWGQILKELGGTFAGIVRAALPAGNQLNDSLLGVVTKWNAFVNSDGGQAKLRRFFQSGEQVLEAVGRAVAAISRALVSIQGNQAWESFFNAITRAAPGIGRLLQAFGPALGGEVAAVARGFAELARVAGPLSPLLGPLALGLVNLFLAVKGYQAAKDGLSGLSDMLGGIGTVAGRARGVLMGAISGVATKDAPLLERAAARIGAALRIPNAVNAVGLTMQRWGGRVLQGLNDLDAKAGAVVKRIGARIAAVFSSGESGSVSNPFARIGAGAKAAEADLAGVATAAQGAAAAEGELAVAGEEAGAASTIAFGPIGLIVAGVVALGVAVYEAYRHIKPFHDAVDAVGRFLRDVFVAAVHEAGKAIGWLADHWRPIVGAVLALLGPIGLVVGVFLNWKQIGPIVSGVFDDVVGFVTGLPGRIWSALSGFGDAVGRFFRDALKLGERVIREQLSVWLDVYVRWPARLFAALAHFGTELYQHAKTWFAELGRGERELLSAAVSWAGGLPGRVWGAIGDFGGALYSRARGWFTRLWDGLKNAWNATVAWIRGLPMAAYRALSDFGRDIETAGWNAMMGLWKGLQDGWNHVTGWLSGLNPASWFNDINVEQGHAETNLLPMGQIVMDGLHRGLRAGWAEVAQWLSTLDPSKAMALSLQHEQTVGRVAAAATAGAVRLATGDTPAAGLVQHFEAGSIVVQNPAPEPASTSLATRMRRLAVMHEPLPRATTTKRPA